MPAPRVVFTQRLNSLWRMKLEPLRRAFPGIELLELTPSARADGGAGSTDVGSAEVADADVLVGGSVFPEMLEAARRLRAVIVPFTGVNSLPLEELRRRGIRVANSHGNARSVAERSLALLLAFFGRVCSFDADLRRGTWHGFAAGESVRESWESLEGKRAAILGTGAIGTEAAGLLRPFGVAVTGFRRSASAGPEVFERVVASLTAAVEGADIVVVALPATAATEGLLDADALRTMKGAVLVNVGRGAIVDEEALFLALKEGTLRGACIDTWFRYPGEGGEGGESGEKTPPSRFPFHELDNVIMSPHVGGYTSQAVERSVEEAVDNLRHFLDTGELRNEIDLSAGY
ncbi:MAG: 2-hydroxyacid dehydrogenase [Spirochaetaceae bacterium]